MSRRVNVQESATLICERSVAVIHIVEPRGLIAFEGKVDPMQPRAMSVASKAYKPGGGGRGGLGGGGLGFLHIECRALYILSLAIVASDDQTEGRLC
jgi:hypothetical protein